MAEPQAYLPLPAPAPVLIPARHLPRTPAGPAPRPLGVLLLRVLGAGSAFGLELRRYAGEFAEDHLTNIDPRKFVEWLNALSTPRSPSFPCRAMILHGGSAEGGLRELLEALLKSATVQGVILVVATLMVLHVGGPGREEDEERHPPPVLPLLPHERRQSDLNETFRIERIFKDKAHKRGLKKSHHGLSSFAKEILSMVQERETKVEKERQTFRKAVTKTSKECEGSLKTKYTKFEATHDRFCKEKAAHVKNFKVTGSEKIFADQQSVKRVHQLHDCLNALKMKQGNKSISMLRKSVTSFLGLRDED